MPSRFGYGLLHRRSAGGARVFDKACALRLEQVSDTALLAVGSTLPLLRSLNLRGCKQLTDVGIACVAQGCAALQEIDVSEVRAES